MVIDIATVKSTVFLQINWINSDLWEETFEEEFRCCSSGSGQNSESPKVYSAFQ